jgi:hydrogenase expression/formation protein HypE
MAVLLQRENLTFDAPIVSDTAALHGMVRDMLDSGAGIRVLRDPTRGGLATTLNEIARQSAVGMLLQESEIPLNQPVEAACEFLGLDPLYVANEGKLLAICAPEDAASLLKVMRSHPLGLKSAVIGEVRSDTRGFVQMNTKLGGRRIVDWLAGEQLPRIC